MRVLKKIARSIILPFALHAKTDKYFLGKTDKTCCIVNFHGVRKNNNDVFNNRHLPEAEFERMLTYLKRNYDIVPLSELFEIYREKRKVKRKTIALTFDDGYANNFDIALPILKKHNAPATFYIISQSLISNNYLVWPDILDVIKKNHKKDIIVNNHVFNYPAFYNETLKLELVDYLKTCGEKTPLLVNEIAAAYNYQQLAIKNFPELTLLIGKEAFLKYIDEPLIEYGSHSHSHFNMEYLDEKTTETELERSKQILENALSKPVISFAFPDGSYTPFTVKAAKQLGYKNIVAVNYRYNEKNTDPNLLARFTISNSTTYESNALRLAKSFDEFGFN